MSDPISDLCDAATRTSKYFRDLAERIGEVEAQHGPESEQAEKLRKEWDRETDRAVEIAGDVGEIADAIRDGIREYNL